MGMDTETLYNHFFRRSLIALGFLFIVLSICGLSYQFFVKRCLVLNCPPARSFTSLELGVPQELFPPEALYSPMRWATDLGWNMTEWARMSVSWDKGSGLAVYNAYRFGTEQLASEHFEASVASSIFIPINANTIDANDNFVSRIADQHDVRCGHAQLGGIRCNLVVRYGEFVLTFSSVIDDNVMTRDHFNQIIEYIDSEMAERLETER